MPISAMSKEDQEALTRDNLSSIKRAKSWIKVECNFCPVRMANETERRWQGRILSAFHHFLEKERTRIRR